MSVSVTSLTHGGIYGPVVTTPSVSVLSKSLLVLWVGEGSGSSPVSVSGLGATWVKAEETQPVQVWGMLTAYTAAIPKAVTGTVTITFDGGQAVLWDLDQVQGVDLQAPFVASNTQIAVSGSPGNASITFATASKTSNKFLFATEAADLNTTHCSPGETPPWTQLADVADPTGYAELESQISPGSSDLTATAVWVGDRFGWVAIGFELNAK